MRVIVTVFRWTHRPVRARAYRLEAGRPPPCRPRSRGAKLSGGPPDKTCSVPSQREMRSTRISLARRTAFVWWVKGLCARWPWLLLCKYYQIGGAPQCGALVGDEDTEPREVM